MPSETRRPFVPATPARRRKLTRLKDVRLNLSRIYRRLEAGEIDLKVAKAMTYTLQILAGVIREVDTEARLDALEGKLKPPKLVSASLVDSASKSDE